MIYAKEMKGREEEGWAVLAHQVPGNVTQGLYANESLTR